jgi:hypothetical protein
VSWTGANPDADPSDPCWVGYAPEVSAEPDRVVVTIRTYRSRVPLGPQQSCTDLGFIRTLAVPLHHELGGRTVVDGHSGRRHRLAPVPLEPRWLPPGWRLVDELGQSGAAGGSWQRGRLAGRPGGGPPGRPRRHRRDRALPGRPGHGRPLAGGPPRAGRGRQLPDHPSGRAVAAVRDLLVRIARGLE